VERLKRDRPKPVQRHPLSIAHRNHGGGCACARPRGLAVSIGAHQTSSVPARWACPLDVPGSCQLPGSILTLRVFRAGPACPNGTKWPAVSWLVHSILWVCADCGRGLLSGCALETEPPPPPPFSTSKLTQKDEEHLQPPRRGLLLLATLRELANGEMGIWVPWEVQGRCDYTLLNRLAAGHMASAITS
jgi:hypothetical protein